MRIQSGYRQYHCNNSKRDSEQGVQRRAGEDDKGDRSVERDRRGGAADAGERQGDSSKRQRPSADSGSANHRSGVSEAAGSRDAGRRASSQQALASSASADAYSASAYTSVTTVHSASTTSTSSVAYASASASSASASVSTSAHSHRGSGSSGMSIEASPFASATLFSRNLQQPQPSQNGALDRPQFNGAAGTVNELLSRAAGCGKSTDQSMSPAIPEPAPTVPREPGGADVSGPVTPAPTETNAPDQVPGGGVDNAAGTNHAGAAHTPFSRIAPQDSSRAPGNNDLPNPRDISNSVFAETADKPDPSGGSDLLWQWGQFIDHDMTKAAEANVRAGETGEAAPIDVPHGDPVLDPRGTGMQEIPFTRSVATLDEHGQRQQTNELTAFLDGSQVYGSDSGTEQSLRRFTGGEMNTSEGNRLPHAPGSTEEDISFAAGDSRVNEQPGLTAMHTLFVREHNRLASEIAAANPHWGDEQIYQAAKSRNIAQMQSITYNEFLPTLLGDDAVAEYQGHNSHADPSIDNEFATAAFRFGHSMVTGDVTRIDADGNRETTGLAENFQSPDMIHEHNIGSVIRGQAFTPANELDNEITGSLRNMLFGPPGTPGGGLDLAALNIQRGRDHELASYNDTREAMGMRRIESFDDPIFKPGVGAKLAAVYAHPDDVDLWVGGMSEATHGESMMGQTFTRINAQQFARLRDADPSYYENVYSGAELDAINDTTLADIIRRNTGVNDIQQDAFRVPPASAHS